MAENSKIEWTDHTVNLWWGCSKVHTGCKNCYAESLSHRYGNDIWGENKGRKRIKSAFKDLDKYQKKAENENTRLRIFCGSMMDIFEDSKILINPIYEDIHVTSDLRIELFNRISDGKYSRLVFQFLTKRPENISLMVPPVWKSQPPFNVWFGTSISDYPTSLTQIAEISKFSYFNLFLSIEPQVDHIPKIDLTNIDWVIQGGESGHGKRPFNIEWAESMRDMCKDQNTPYFFKQIDKVQEIPEHLKIREFPKAMQVNPTK